jgi:hypothetical protein
MLQPSGIAGRGGATDSAREAAGAAAADDFVTYL